MNAFGIVAVALLAISASAERATEIDGLPVVYNYKVGDKCPAEYFYNCSPDGKHVVCTKMACPPHQRAAPFADEHEQVYAPNYKQGDKCPGKYFNDGCNHCICNTDGVSAACTMKLCLERRSEQVYAPSYKAGDKCPGKYFSDGCNACVCGEDGVTAACTLKVCALEPKLHSIEQASVETVYATSYAQGDKCPGKFFNDGCNACICGTDGVSAACTQKFCFENRSEQLHSPIYVQGEKCPGKFFHDGCNVCSCRDDGVSAACTKIFCFPSVPPQI